MLTHSPFNIAIRILIYLLLAGFCIFLLRLPINFTDAHVWNSCLIYVLTAIMIVRFPNQMNLILIAFMSLIYAILTDEGIALGAVALITFAIILNVMLQAQFISTFITEIIIVSVTFALIILLRNILLDLLLTYHFTLIELALLIKYFVIFYTLTCVLTRFILRVPDRELER